MGAESISAEASEDCGLIKDAMGAGDEEKARSAAKAAIQGVKNHQEEVKNAQTQVTE